MTTANRKQKSSSHATDMVDKFLRLEPELRHWRASDIAGHAMISDGETGALVYRDGTIDWLCMPQFDSEPCMAALLGTGANGAWWLRPRLPIRSVRRSYDGDTMILRTVIETDEGAVRLIDFMPAARRQAPDIVRIVEGISGEIEMISRIALRFSEGLIHPLREFADGDRRGIAVAGDNAVALDSTVPLRCREGAEDCSFTVRPGGRESFVLTWYASHEERPDPVDADKAVDETRKIWTDWAARCDLEGENREVVIRSLLVLKGLVHWQTGGMLAALTSSLPEAPGGVRNWDYRYCWLRDATFALLAFLRAGYRDEAKAWIDWLRRAVAGQPIVVQPFYRVDGGRLTMEREADWLEGFCGSRPVHFGNAASGQLQLDIYGEVIDALYVAGAEGLTAKQDIIPLLAEEVEKRWCERDDGLWESRGPQQHYVYSKAMCWVAFDRTARYFSDMGDEERSRHWNDLAESVREEVLERGYDERLGAFTQSYDTLDLDASVLRLPLCGFIEPRDERMIQTVSAIEKQLMHDGFVWRYKANGADGLEGEEGSFLACSSWLVDVYIAQGRTQDARALFKRIRGAANDLGLLSEEWHPGQRLALGNFPQALSHVALINNAYSLESAGRSLRADRAGID